MVSTSMMANTTKLMAPNQISQGATAGMPLCQRVTAGSAHAIAPPNEKVSGMQNSLMISIFGAGDARCA